MSEKTTGDLVAEYAEGQEPELTPAAENVDLGPEIEPYEEATPVPIEDDDERAHVYQPRNTE